jgi:hypothetical protein
VKQETLNWIYSKTQGSIRKHVARCLVNIVRHHRDCGTLILIALSLSACSNAIKAQEPQGASLPIHPTLIIIGDSVMAESFDGPATTASSLITRDYNWYVVDISNSGQTLLNAVRLEIWKAVEFTAGDASENVGKDPQRVSVAVQLGHNDWFWWGVGPERFEKNYRKLLTELNSLPVTTYCVVPLPARWDYNGKRNTSNLQYEDIRVIVRKLAGLGLCRLIETRHWYTEKQINKGSAMPDALHLSGEGHAIFTKNLMDELTSNQSQAQ